MMDVAYDNHGRMKYNPEFHGNHKKPWTTIDQKYLIENYEILGPEAISLALERTITTVTERACQLRKQGQMVKPQKKSYHKRSFSGGN